MNYNRSFQRGATSLLKGAEPAVVYRRVGTTVNAQVHISREIRDVGDYAARPEFLDIGYFEDSIYRPSVGDYFIVGGVKWKVVGTLDDCDGFMSSARIQKA